MKIFKTCAAIIAIASTFAIPVTSYAESQSKGKVLVIMSQDFSYQPRIMRTRNNFLPDTRYYFPTTT